MGLRERLPILDGGTPTNPGEDRVELGDRAEAGVEKDVEDGVGGRQQQSLCMADPVSIDALDERHAKPRAEQPHRISALQAGRRGDCLDCQRFLIVQSDMGQHAVGLADGRNGVGR